MWLPFARFGFEISIYFDRVKSNFLFEFWETLRFDEAPWLRFAQSVEKTIEGCVRQKYACFVEHVSQGKTVFAVRPLVDWDVKDGRCDLGMRVHRHVFHDLTLAGV
ncbi:hypothetical protein HMPREF2902_09620 [Actinomyces sp. HMSC035G02]|nr:hypothetical protein HMPREF2902_09620 [Actinomyces sp. HMSC035G02]